MTTPHSPDSVRKKLQRLFARSKLDGSSFRLDGSSHCIGMVGVLRLQADEVPGKIVKISIIFCFVSQSNSIAADRGLSGVAMKPARLYPPNVGHTSAFYIILMMWTSEVAHKILADSELHVHLN